jgi:hypothetical protein
MGSPIKSVMKNVAAAGLVGVTGGASLALMDRGKQKSPRIELPARASDRPEGVLQSSKSRKRVAASRGRRSFRIALTDPEPRQTRGGLSIG